MATYETSPSYVPVSQVDVNTRATFITRTYAHVVGSILLFAGIEAYLFSSGLAAKWVGPMLSVNWEDWRPE